MKFSKMRHASDSKENLRTSQRRYLISTKCAGLVDSIDAEKQGSFETCGAVCKLHVHLVTRA